MYLCVSKNLCSLCTYVFKKKMDSNEQLIKKLNTAAWIVSIAVLTLVALMRKIHIQTNIDFSFLPPLYSTMNAIAAIFLIRALNFIRKKDIESHKKMIYIALSMSFLFLLLYVLYHITTPETKYCGNAGWLYFPLLITHIVLASVSFPFILFTFVRGYTMQVEKHRKMAKWVFWLWLYVAITGPICYLMLMPCYH
jgi:putative membrane protein